MKAFRLHNTQTLPLRRSAACPAPDGCGFMVSGGGQMFTCSATVAAKLKATCEQKGATYIYTQPLCHQAAALRIYLPIRLI